MAEMVDQDLTCYAMRCKLGLAPIYRPLDAVFHDQGTGRPFDSVAKALPILLRNIDLLNFFIKISSGQ